MITQEIIDKLNTLINEAVDHGGDSGGNYFTNANRLYQSVLDILALMDKENKTEIVWQHPITGNYYTNKEMLKIEPTYREIPIIRFKEIKDEM